LSNEITLRLRSVGEMHTPSGEEHSEDRNLSPDPIRALILRIGVGPDPQIAALPIVDAFTRDQTLRADIRRGRQPFARPLDWPAGRRIARARVPITVERDPVARTRPRRIGATDGHSGPIRDTEDR